MAKFDFRVPCGFVPKNPGERSYAYRRRCERAVVERCLETGMDDLVSATAMPDGTIKVWGEAGASRPPTSRQAFEQGWERAFGGGQ